MTDSSAIKQPSSAVKGSAGELIARLEAATEGSRELDSAIALTVGWTFEKRAGETKRWWREPNGPVWFRDTSPPFFTTSLDAAMTLVPDGYFWRMGHVEQLSEDDEVMYGAELLRYLHVADRSDSMGHGLTAPIALCIAALKARSPAKPSQD